MPEPTHYQGQCHCGKARFTLSTEQPLQQALRCNCSICHRLGALMTPRLAPEQIQLLSERSDLEVYSHGDKDILFTFCKHCHVFVFFEPSQSGGFCRVNLNCVDDLDVSQLETVFFDGRKLL